MQNITKKIKQINKSKLILFIAYLAVSLFFTLNHEPWRDEAQAWLIARDAGGIGGIFSLTGYEGSPALWQLILYPFASAGLPFTTIFVIHFILNTLTAFLLIFKSPFKIYQIALIIFGYYTLIEYNVIARSYILTYLGIVLFAINYNSILNKKNWLGFALAVFITSWSNLLGFIISILLSGYYLFINWRKLKTNWEIYSVIFLTIIFTSVVIQLIPPSDLGPHNSFLFSISLHEMIGAVLTFTNAFVGNLLDFFNIINGISPFLLLTYIISLLAILILLVLFFVGRKKPFILFFILTAILITFFYIQNLGSTSYRHCGIIYLIFVFVSWITYYDIKNKLQNFGFSILLFIGVLISLLNLFAYSRPFSNSMNVYDYLKVNDYISDNTFIATNKGAMTSVIIANLPLDTKIYSADLESYPTYIKWDTNYLLASNRSTDQIINSIITEFEKSNKENAVFIVSSYFIDNIPSYLGYSITKIKSYDGSFKYDEDFDIYYITREESLS